MSVQPTTRMAVDMVIHHRRAENTVIETQIASAGSLRIEPPGLTIGVSDLFGSDRP